LPVPGGPTISTPRGPHSASARVSLRFLQELDDLIDLLLGALVAGHVGEPRGRALRVVHLRAGPEDAPETTGDLSLRTSREPDVDADQQHEGQETQENVEQCGPRRGLAGDLDVLRLQVVGEPRVLERGRDLRRVLPTRRQRSAHRSGRIDLGGLDLALVDLRQELRVAELHRLVELRIGHSSSASVISNPARGNQRCHDGGGGGAGDRAWSRSSPGFACSVT
jgi:hypothetical protein